MLHKLQKSLHAGLVTMREQVTLYFLTDKFDPTYDQLDFYQIGSDPGLHRLVVLSRFCQKTRFKFLLHF